jgi:acyl carrier protein
VSADPSLVAAGALDQLVRRLVADVLVVPLDQVTPDCSLMADLGAESIDFLDLIFQLEEALGKRIPFTHWQKYLEQRFGTGDLSQRVTPRVVLEFAVHQAQSE